FRAHIILVTEQTVGAEATPVPTSSYFSINSLLNKVRLNDPELFVEAHSDNSSHLCYYAQYIANK
ncbi:hypothetical protein JZO73_06535, partial [Enterococcus plantarum]|uniref:hypothetical protein n=1 Tax=Enterococcus plantarum TaxID=1077675 RepID=UPI001A902A86